MKKLLALLLLLGISGIAQNLTSYTSGTDGEMWFAKSFAKSGPDLVCTSGNPFFPATPQLVYFMTYNQGEITTNQSFASLDSQDAFGAKVVLKDDYAAVSAPNYSGGGFGYMGAVHLYHRVNGLWSFVQRISSPNPGFNFRFGIDIALSGTQLIISEPHHIPAATPMLTGKIYVYDLTDSAATLAQSFGGGEGFLNAGNHLDADENKLTFSYVSAGESKIAVFSFENNQWHNVANLSVTSNENPISCLAVKGSKVFCGSNDGLNLGQLKIFGYDGIVWNEQGNIVLPAGNYGISAVDGNEDTILAGMSSTFSVNGKASCLVYKNTNGNWLQAETISGDAPEGSVDFFGNAVLVEAENYFIAARSEGSSAQGKLYFGNTSTLSNSQTTLSKGAIYPNPVQNWLHLDAIPHISKTEIYNLSGQLLQVDNSSNVLQMGHLPKGFYILKVYDPASYQTFKVLKN